MCISFAFCPSTFVCGFTYVALIVNCSLFILSLIVISLVGGHLGCPEGLLVRNSATLKVLMFVL